MNQSTLFADVDTVPSPICSAWDGYKGCRKRGRAVYGPARDLGGCINRSILCLTCQKTGEQSTRKDLA